MQALAIVAAVVVAFIVFHVFIGIAFLIWLVIGLVLGAVLVFLPFFAPVQGFARAVPFKTAAIVTLAVCWLLISVLLHHHIIGGLLTGLVLGATALAQAGSRSARSAA